MSCGCSIWRRLLPFPSTPACASFSRTSDSTHPLKIALQKLQTLDTVRIIEGTAK